MRTYLSSEWIRLGGDFNVRKRFTIQDAAGIDQDLSTFLGVNWMLSVSGDADINNPVESLTIKLRRQTQTPAGDDASIAPLMGNSPGNDTGPLLDLNRPIKYETAVVAQGATPLDSDWHTRFIGIVTAVDGGSDDDTVTVTCADLGAILARTSVTEDSEYGTDAGQDIEDVFDLILAEWAPGVSLVVPESPGWKVRPFLLAQDYLLTDLRNLALQIGHEARYRFNGASEVPAFTLYVPSRDQTTPDLVIGPADYFDIPRLPIDDADIRNAWRGGYTDAETGAVLYRTKEDATSIALYGRRFAEFTEDATSNIDTADEMDLMLDAALADTAYPYATMDVGVSDLWMVQLGDVIGLNPNDRVFDSAQLQAVQAIHWEHSEDGGAYMTLTVRGRPSASYRDWLNREGTGPSTDVEVESFRLVNFREKSRDIANRTVTFVWDDAPGAAEIWAYETTLPVGSTAEKYPVGTAAAPTQRLTGDTRELVVSVPPLGSVKYVQVQPMSSAKKAGDAVRVTVTAVGAPPRFGELTQTPLVSGLAVTLTLEVIDPQAFGGVLRAWVNHDDTENAEPVATPDGSITLDATPRVVGGLDLFTTPTGDQYTLRNIRVHPGRGKRIYFEFTNAEGTSTGLQGFVLLSSGGIIDEAGNIVDGAINDARNFVASLVPPRIVSTLPPDGAGFEPGQMATLTTDGRLYRWTGSEWIAVNNAPEMVGQVVSAQIADAAINTAKFANGLQPVLLIPSTATAGSEGQVAFDQATGRLLRYTGGAWTDAIPSASLIGQLVTSQLADGIITATKITDGAITTPKIFAGAIGTNQLAANAVTANNILAGAIVAGKIAANAVVAGTIQAGAVRATEIAADAIRSYHIFSESITADKIAANAITAVKIAADAITSAKIQAGAITAGKLSADSVTAGTIAAGAVTATAIAAKAVKATMMEVSVLSDIKDAFGQSTGIGIIVSGRLQDPTGSRYLDLSASGSAPFLHHPAFDLRADGSARFGGEVSSASFTAGQATFSGDILIGSTSGIIRFADPSGLFSRAGQIFAEFSAGLRIEATRQLTLTGGNGVRVTAGMQVDNGLTVSAGGLTLSAGSLNVAGYGFFTSGVSISGRVDTYSDFAHHGTYAGFFGASPVPRPIVRGNADGNVALLDLLFYLGPYGLGLIQYIP